MSLSLPNWDNVIARLDSLEAQNLALLRQNRRMKRLGAAALILAGLLVFLAQVRPTQADNPKSKKVIEANEFLVKDESGNELFSSDSANFPNGKPSIEIYMK